MICIVCGRSEEEVKKLFCFPRQLLRSNKWQLLMGMTPRGVLSGHIRICNQHFCANSFVPSTTTLRLRADALPTVSPAHTTCSRPATHVQPDEILPNARIQTLSDCIIPAQESSLSLDIPTVISQPQASCSNKLDLASEIISTPKKSQISSTATGVRGRRSLFKNIDNLCSGNISPKKRALMGIVKRKQRQLRKLQKKCKDRGKTIAWLQNVEKQPEMSNIFKNLSPLSVQFMIGQIRCGKKSPHGRRWTLDEKVLALSLYKRSPKCYALLRRLTTLPSKDSLIRLLKKVPFEVGINKHIFEHLGECLKSFGEKDRLCSIVFDEMAIREHVQYNSARDCIEGLEDFGEHDRTERLAKYALVFLAQGVTKPWKQPIAYYFSQNGVSSIKLQSVLRDVLNAMHEVHIPVLATICDMGTANVKMLKDMGSTTNNPYIELNGMKIFTIFDVPHLLKCFRNLFRNHNVWYSTIGLGDSPQSMDARWSDIVKAYEEDKKNPLIFRSLHKLKDFYLAPLRQTAMKVKVAAQIMSRSVSVFLFNLIQREILPARALATATFIHDVDEMFDSLNGTSKTPPDGKPYRCMVTEDSGHVAFWEDCSKNVSKLRFIRKPSDISNPHLWKPPSQKGWLFTLRAFQQMWSFMKTIGIKHFKPRSLNQDALENLFGTIRTGCGSNENPTVAQFVSSLKTQIINGLTHQSLEGTNCEEDQLNLLSNLRSFLDVSVESESREPEFSISKSKDQSAIKKSGLPDDKIVQEIENCVTSGSLQILSVAYVSGFIVKKLFKYFTCCTCYGDLCSDDLQPWNQFISLKEFSDKVSKLFYPSEKLVVLVGCAITFLEEELISLRKALNIQIEVAAIIHKKVDFSFLTCLQHHDFLEKCIIKSICRIGIPWYCTRLVRDLKSKSYQKASDRKQRKLQHI